MEITSSESSHIPVASACQQPHPRSPVDPPGRALPLHPVFGEALGSGCVTSWRPCGLVA